MELLLEEYGGVIFFLLFFAIVISYFYGITEQAIDGTLYQNYINS